MSGQKLEWDLDKKILFSEIGPPGFTPPGFGRTLQQGVSDSHGFLRAEEYP